MNLTIKRVLDIGNINRERVVLGVTRDDEIGNYMIAQGTTTEAGGLSQSLKPLCWFPDNPVKAGDLVVLYTKVGAQKKKVNADKSTSHFFYLGLGKCLWEGDKRAAVV